MHWTMSSAAGLSLLALAASSALPDDMALLQVQGGASNQQPALHMKISDASSDTIWTSCANQWEVCTCAGTIRWGAKTTWKMVEPPRPGGSHTVECNINALGDNLVGDTTKRCECAMPTGTVLNQLSEGAASRVEVQTRDVQLPVFSGEMGSKGLSAIQLAVEADSKKNTAQVDAAAATANAIWMFCSEQWQECNCPGAIRWGASNTWKIIMPPNPGQSHSVKCDIKELGDNLPGNVGKRCECAVTRSSAFKEGINLAMLPVAARSKENEKELGSLEVASCGLFEAGASDTKGPGAAQWRAVQGLCTPSAAKSGPRALDTAVLQRLMQAWVDKRFASNYKRLYDKSGWVNNAFVNYISGAPDGKHWNMTEELVRSVHLFSKEPIVVVNFGMSAPAHWNAELFPRLVLLHALPIPSDAGRSFNFNKYRAMLMARTRVGVQQDSDQFVAPGVDNMFHRTAQEVTEQYPMPILPAHFLDRGPVDLGAWWKRFCPEGDCKFQTTRWSHAHPTWSFWALPFLGRWLRANFRDEELPRRNRPGGVMAALRVVDVPEDEDLLNVGLWEEGGTKQWCKFDMPDPGEFQVMLQTKADLKCTHPLCDNIGADPRWHPNGVAKVFYTAHHAVHPEVSHSLIQALAERQKVGDLPPPILFDRQWFKDGDALKKAKRKATCLI